MATAKKTPTAKTTKSTKPAGTAVAIANVPLPANYEETRADRMAAFKSRLQVTESNKIQVTQDKHFKLPNADGESEKTDTIAGIIVDFASRKAFYETAFDRDNPVPPNCFAIGFASFDELTPSPNSPECQSEDGCGSCALNKFEKLPNGKYKAKDCKDSYRLALLAPDGSGDGKLMTLDISATAIKSFDSYVRTLMNMDKNLHEVVTEFSFDPASEYPSIRCRMIDDVPEKALGYVVAQQQDAEGIVSQEPDVSEFEEKVIAKRAPAPKKRRA